MKTQGNVDIVELCYSTYYYTCTGVSSMTELHKVVPIVSRTDQISAESVGSQVT